MPPSPRPESRIPVATPRTFCFDVENKPWVFPGLGGVLASNVSLASSASAGGSKSPPGTISNGLHGCLGFGTFVFQEFEFKRFWYLHKCPPAFQGALKEMIFQHVPLSEPNGCFHSSTRLVLKKLLQEKWPTRTNFPRSNLAKSRWSNSIGSARRQICQGDPPHSKLRISKSNGCQVSTPGLQGAFGKPSFPRHSQPRHDLWDSARSTPATLEVKLVIKEGIHITTLTCHIKFTALAAVSLESNQKP